MSSNILIEVEEFSIRKAFGFVYFDKHFNFRINNSQLTLNNLPHLCEKIKIGVGKNKI
jgi:hypothetical protein